MIKFGSNNIGKVYLGSNPIGKAYLGSNLVYQKGSGPSPSTGIPYIRNTDVESYIDTGITPNNTTRVIIWARNVNAGSTNTNIFGARDSYTSGIFSLSIASGADIGTVRLGYNTTHTIIEGDKFKYLSNYHKYELNGNILYIDDAVIGNVTPGTFSGSSNIHLFGIHYESGHYGSGCPIDICACKIYKDNVLVRDFTAVETPSVGLYDAVSDTVFTNIGGGSFTYGTIDPSAYTPLEYITCEGNQYFDSGVYGAYGESIVSKFMPTNTTPKWNTLLGYRTTTNCCDISFGTATSGQDNMRLYWRFGQNDTSGQAFSGSTSNKLTNSEVVVIKSGATLTVYHNNTQIGSNSKTGVPSSFQTEGTIAIGTHSDGETFANECFIGRIYYISFGASANFVPAKKGSRVGMYDTYNDVFYPSATSTPFIAGPKVERQLTHFFRGKNLAIIGDSISTYDAVGYKYDSYSMYYPYGEVDSVEYTYWKKLMNDENATLEVNLSYSGSCVCSRSGYVSLNDRIGLIGNADTVIIALGTNDSGVSKPLGDYLYDTPYSELGETNFREAYIKGIKGLLAANPNLTIVCAIFSMDADYRNSITEIAQHYELKCIDCGNSYAKVQGVHPSMVGMQEIENHFLYD